MPPAPSTSADAGGGDTGNADGGPDPDAGWHVTDSGLPPCTGTSPVYRVRRPTTLDNLYTPSLTEVENAKAQGFTENLGTAFYAYPVAGPGQVPVFQLYNYQTKHRFWTANPDEKTTALQKYYPVDEGIAFYATSLPGTCGVPVYRMKAIGGNVLLAVYTEERASLKLQGWEEEGVKFTGGAP